jgi:hypothetical protein
MWDDLASGNLPRPDLRNLDIYHEIGLEQDHEAILSLADEAYQSLYEQRLADRDAVTPLAEDGRLWRQTMLPREIAGRRVA